MHSHNHDHKTNTDPKFDVYKNLLLNEQERLIDSMSFLGHMTHEVPGDWTVDIGTPEDIREFDSTSDRIEEITTNESILETLEERLREINTALEKIEKGNFGICDICKKDIEHDKLKANPATTRCMSCEIK